MSYKMHSLMHEICNVLRNDHRTFKLFQFVIQLSAFTVDFASLVISSCTNQLSYLMCL